MIVFDLGKFIFCYEVDKNYKVDWLELLEDLIIDLGNL